MTEAVAVRKTFFNRVALPVFSWGLPFHSLIIAMLFGGLGLGLATVRSLAAWKEAFVIALVLLVILRAVTGRGPRVGVHWVDLAVLSLIAIAAVFALAGNAFFQIDLPKGAEAFGMRDIAFFLLLYFVGRASPEIADDPNTLRRLYIVVLLSSAIAVVEWLLVTPDMLVLLGVASYFQDFLNVSAFTGGNDYGLPTNYWTRIGSVDVQRAGSIYLSSQSFAIPFLILLPVATAYVFGAAKRVTTSMKVEYAIIWMGLLLSITRMTIFVCMIQLVLMVIMLRKPEWAVAGIILAGTALVIAIFTVPNLGGFVWDTLAGQTGSNASHSKDFAKGITAFIEHPFGNGLGTTDQTAIRVGLSPLTADNGYLKYAVELGIEGLIAHVLIYVGILVTSFKVARHALTVNRRLLGTVVFFCTIGIMINAMTGVVFNAPVLTYLYFWFAGSVVSISQMERVPKAARQPAQRLELSAA
jgi:hypothetical protein